MDFVVFETPMKITSLVIGYLTAHICVHITYFSISQNPLSMVIVLKSLMGIFKLLYFNMYLPKSGHPVSLSTLVLNSKD